MRIVAMFLWVFISSYLSFGCTLSARPDFSASGLGQYSNPSTVVDLKKRRIEISSEANGNLTIDDATLSEDGTFHLKGSANYQSNPSPVIDAEGRRMPGTVLAASQLHMMEMSVKLDEGLTERHRIAGQNLEKVFNGLALLVGAGGEAVNKWIDATAPILKGSGASLDLGSLGSGAINLGTSIPLPAPVLVPAKP